MVNPLENVPDIEVTPEAVITDNTVVRQDFYTELVDRLNLDTYWLSTLLSTDAETVNTSGTVLPRGTVYGFNESNEMAKALSGTSRVQAVGVVLTTAGKRESFAGQNSGMQYILLEAGINPQPYDRAYLSATTPGAVTNVSTGADIQEMGIFKGPRQNDGRALVSVIMNMSEAGTSDLYTGTTALIVGDICYFSADGVLTKSDATDQDAEPQVVVTDIVGSEYQVAWPSGIVLVNIAGGGTAPSVGDTIILSDTEAGTAVIFQDDISAGSFEFLLGRCVGDLVGGLCPINFSPEVRPVEFDSNDIQEWMTV